MSRIHSLLADTDPNYYVANTYIFSGEPNQAIMICVTNDNGFCFIRDPDQNITNQIYGNNCIVTVLSTNTYTIEIVQAAQNLSTYSNYSLSIDCEPTNVPNFAILLGTNGIIPNGAGIDFGVTSVGWPVPAYLTITNSGTTNLNVWFDGFVSGNGNNGSFMVTDTSLTNYTYSWNSLAVPPGGSTNLTLWFMALWPGQTNDTIKLGWESDDGNQEFTINLIGRANMTNSVPPVVEITNPVPNTVFLAKDGESGISITATSAPAPGYSICGVNFYAKPDNGNNILIDQEFAQDGNGNYTFSYWHAVPPGNYQLTAVAIDNFGLQTVSAPVPITVLLRDTNSPDMQVLWGTTNLPSGSTINFGVAGPNIPVSVELVITNLGTGTLTNCYLSTDWWIPQYSIATNSPQGFSLAPGTSTNVTVLFQSGTFGYFPAHLYIDGNDEGLYGPYNNNQTVGRIALQLTGMVTNTGIPPSVILTNPTPNSVLYSPSSITLQALVTNLSGSQSFNVEFYAAATNGTIDLGGGSFNPASGYYEYTWTPVPLGQYTLTAEATDSSGLATLSSPVSITVLARPPTSPVLQTFLGTNMVGDNATIVYSPTAVGASNLAFLTLSNSGNADLVISNVSINTGYGNDFTLTNVFSGAFTIQAGQSTNLAVSFAPSYAQSDETGTLTITNGDVARNPLVIALSGHANPVTTPPTIEITYPSPNAVYTSWPTISITATSAPASGASPSSIYFYATDTNGSNVLGQLGAGNIGGNAYTANWVNVPPGNYHLMAVARDNFGLQTVSAPVPITVLLHDTNSPNMEVLFEGATNLPSGSAINFGFVPTNTQALISLLVTNMGPGTLTNGYLNLPSGFSLTNSSLQNGFSVGQ
jgi:hypothetical protein